MSWPGSLFIALLTAILGLFASGVVANLAVSWYRISSFEGGAGYFVIGMALLGGIIAAIIGVVTARIVAGGADPSFLRALGISSGIVLGAAGAIGGVARLLADVPPEIDGKRLLLEVEFRWPEAAPDPRTLPGEPRLHFGALGSFSRVVRWREEGALFMDLARREDGRWVVPGVVGIFTSRGRRIVDVEAGDTMLGGFLVPLPGRPGEKEREWSRWLPEPRSGDPPLPPGMLTYRFRVRLTGVPVRTDSVGPFEVGTQTYHFYRATSTSGLSATSTFQVRHRGEPVPGIDSVEAVAAVAGPAPALLVATGGPDEECRLLVAEGDSVRVVTLGWAGHSIRGKLVSNDVDRFRTARDTERREGWLDRTTFAESGLYLINDNALFDTRTLAAAPLEFPDGPWPRKELGLLAVSPDGRSVVWFADDDNDTGPLLGVTDYQAGRWYPVPIDRARMRYNEEKDLDPAWVAHHFHWVRGADGRDSLAPRPGFKPLPYKGRLDLGSRPTDFQYYTLRPAGHPLRDAITEFLVTEMGGERLPDELGGYHQVVQLDGRPLKLSVVENPGWVTVALEPKDRDDALMRKVANRLDEAVGSGRFDALFVAPER
jgi:hypothetical protein